MELSKRWIAAAGLGVWALAVGAWLLSAPHPKFSKSQALQEADDAERGRVIFIAGDCASCHASPGQSDRLRLGGGLALASPYGTFRVPNISPDPTDGIGSIRRVLGFWKLLFFDQNPVTQDPAHDET